MYQVSVVPLLFAFQDIRQSVLQHPKSLASSACPHQKKQNISRKSETREGESKSVGIVCMTGSVQSIGTGLHCSNITASVVFEHDDMSFNIRVSVQYNQRISSLMSFCYTRTSLLLGKGSDFETHIDTPIWVCHMFG